MPVRLSSHSKVKRRSVVLCLCINSGQICIPIFSGYSEALNISSTKKKIIIIINGSQHTSGEESLLGQVCIQVSVFSCVLRYLLEAVLGAHWIKLHWIKQRWRNQVMCLHSNLCLEQNQQGLSCNCGALKSIISEGWPCSPVPTHPGCIFLGCWDSGIWQSLRTVKPGQTASSSGSSCLLQGVWPRSH